MGNQNERKKILLTGDRPTGKLHLGHYVGSLRNRVAMQNSGKYIPYIFIYDLSPGQAISFFKKYFSDCLHLRINKRPIFVAQKLKQKHIVLIFKTLSLWQLLIIQNRLVENLRTC